MSDKPSRALRVLLVEDDHDHAELIQALLAEAKLADFVVDRAAGAAPALERVRASDGPGFDVVILDYRLQDGDGLALLAKLREAGLDAPAILLTGFGSERLVASALRAGVDDYMAKIEGVEGTALARAVLRVVERRALAAELVAAREQVARAQAAMVASRTAAHSLAGPLGVISLISDLLAEHPGLPGDCRSDVEEIRQQVRRAREVLEQLRAVRDYVESPSSLGPLLELEPHG